MPGDSKNNHRARKGQADCCEEGIPNLERSDRQRDGKQRDYVLPISAHPESLPHAGDCETEPRPKGAVAAELRI